MIKSLNGLAFRFFRQNKFIALSSIVSVAISISLIVTMALFMSNAKQSLVHEVQKMFGNMDVSVGFNPEQDKVIDGNMLQALTSHEEIAESSSVLLTRLYLDQIGDTVYTIGAENDSLAKSRYHFTADVYDNEVILNERLANHLQLQVGDSLEIENFSYTVKEITSNLEAAGPVFNTLILSKNMLQRLEFENTGINNEATYILMKLHEGFNVMPFVTTLQSIDSDLRIDVATEDPFLKNNLQLLNQFMIVLSILVLLLTSLFIISNFEVFLYKYNNQLAIMRALGASTKQIFKVMLLQSSLMNGIGAMFAFVFVSMSHRFISTWLGNVLSIPLSTSDFNLALTISVIGISALIIQLFMLIPAYRSSKVLPLTVMQQNEKIDLPYEKLRMKVALGSIATSIGLIALGVAFSHLLASIVIGAIGLLVGCLLLLPTYMNSLLHILLPIMKRLFGNISFVTVKNLIPQMRRNILVVFIICSVMIVAIFGSTFIKTIQYNDEQYVKQQFPTDIVLSNTFSEEASINMEQLQQEVHALPNVDSMSMLSESYYASIRTDARVGEIDYAYATIKEMEAQQLLPQSDHYENPIIIQQKVAEQFGLAIGDQIEAELFFDSPVGMFTVANIVETLPNWSDALINWGNNIDEPVLYRTFIESEKVEEAVTELQQLKSLFPTISIESYEQSLALSKQMFSQRWSIFIAVLAVVLISVMMGVVNTLIHNIHTKKKEYAILRAISLNRKNIVQVIMTQVGTFLFVGLFFGIVVGLIFTYSMSFIDSATIIRLDWTLLTSVIGFMIVITCFIFIPFAHKIGSLPIPEQLTEDNK